MPLFLSLWIVGDAFTQNTECQNQGPQSLQGLSPWNTTEPSAAIWGTQAELENHAELGSYAAKPGLHWCWEGQVGLSVQGVDNYTPLNHTDVIRRISFGIQRGKEGQTDQEFLKQIWPFTLAPSPADPQRCYSIMDLPWLPELPWEGWKKLSLQSSLQKDFAEGFQM